MTKKKLFGISFLLAFVSTAILCVVTGLPLIFSPASYKLINFIVFGILIGMLCFGLVYIALPFLTFIRRITHFKGQLTPYYIFATTFILQILTLALGYLESSMTRGVEATLVYYYASIGNSFIYILTGNVTAILAAIYYSKDQLDQENARQVKFDFDA